MKSTYSNLDWETHLNLCLSPTKIKGAKVKKVLL